MRGKLLLVLIVLSATLIWAQQQKLYEDDFLNNVPDIFGIHSNISNGEEEVHSLLQDFPTRVEASNNLLFSKTIWDTASLLSERHRTSAKRMMFRDSASLLTERHDNVTCDNYRITPTFECGNYANT